MPKLIDLTGKRFGRLVVIERAGKDKWGSYLWLSKCECGRTMIVSSGNLRSKHTKSCGCLQVEKITCHNTRHGHCKNGVATKIYSAWATMVQRCTNSKNKQYPDYGARGIIICDRWKSFENFIKDMGKCPEGYSLERIDNNKGYNPNNCKWATPKQQSRNTRSNRLIHFNDKTQCVAAWSEETGTANATINWRLKNGWSIKETLTTPTKKRGHK